MLAAHMFAVTDIEAMSPVALRSFGQQGDAVPNGVAGRSDSDGLSINGHPPFRPLWQRAEKTEKELAGTGALQPADSKDLTARSTKGTRSTRGRRARLAARTQRFSTRSASVEICGVWRGNCSSISQRTIHSHELLLGKIGSRRAAHEPSVTKHSDPVREPVDLLKSVSNIDYPAVLDLQLPHEGEEGFHIVRVQGA